MATNSPITEAATIAPEVEPGVGHLSFTGRRADDSGVSLWAPAPVSGDWIEQCRAGRNYGHEAAEYIRKTKDGAALGAIVQAMMSRGSFGGVEAGFFAAVSMNLAA